MNTESSLYGRSNIPHWWEKGTFVCISKEVFFHGDSDAKRRQTLCQRRRRSLFLDSALALTSILNLSNYRSRGNIFIQNSFKI